MVRSMKLTATGLVLLMVSLAAGESQPGSQNTNAKSPNKGAATAQAAENASRQLAAAFTEAFNGASAKGIAALWTANGEYFDTSGKRYDGRDAIERKFAGLFAANPGATIQLTIDSVRLLGDTVAIEDGRARIAPAPLGTPARSKYCGIYIQSNGKWLIASLRDASLESPSTYNHLRGLEWLIGSWIVADQRENIQLAFRWGANKSSIERTYTSTNDGGMYDGESFGMNTVSGKQIIAWDPETRRVQSWTFQSDGSRWVGVWTPQEGSWTVEMSGVAPDGTGTTAMNRFTKIDDNTMAWQSTQPMPGGNSLPEPAEVVMQRVPGTR